MRYIPIQIGSSARPFRPAKRIEYLCLFDRGISEHPGICAVLRRYHNTLPTTEPFPPPYNKSTANHRHAFDLLRANGFDPVRVYLIEASDCGDPRGIAEYKIRVAIDDDDQWYPVVGYYVVTRESMMRYGLSLDKYIQRRMRFSSTTDYIREVAMGDMLCDVDIAAENEIYLLAEHYRKIKYGH